MKKLFYILLALFTISCSSGSSNNKQSQCPNIIVKSETPAKSEIYTNVDWQEFGFNSLFKAKVQNKFIILFIYSKSCSVCKYMFDNVYTDKEIINLIGSRFVAIKVNHDENPQILNNFADKEIVPTTVFLNPEGVSLGVISGGIKSDAYKKFLNMIIFAADSNGL